ncbi:hypothetical protein B0H13DRAFT_2229619 [Mycena leptocephala]|nr:hypothetical protein B0H13DRAFT_2229619 [Mycena leptocephala]
MYTSTLLALTTLATFPRVLAQVGVHSTFSDCQALTDPATWDSAFNTVNTCKYGSPDNIFHFPAMAYNTACHGNCCVYWAASYGGSGPTVPDKEQTRQDAMGLFGCADTAKNKINAMVFKDDGYGVCLSNGNGCSDCFDDKDFSGHCSKCG